MVKVKICGITRLDDALAAAEYGADALGFVFYNKSPRNIEPAEATEIVRKLPPFLTPVALFVNEKEKRVRDILKVTGINVIQFHGDETPAYISGFMERTIKAVRVSDEASLKIAEDYDVNAFLLDAWSSGTYGGTGKSFDWRLVEKMRPEGRIILAGGLAEENVSEAIDIVRPYGVDVSSGVEKTPGIKDHEKLDKFIRKAKGC